jgi:hypothetical protein
MQARPCCATSFHRAIRPLVFSLNKFSLHQLRTQDLAIWIVVATRRIENPIG